MMIRIGIGITGNGGKGKTGSVIPPSGMVFDASFSTVFN